LRAIVKAADRVQLYNIGQNGVRAVDKARKGAAALFAAYFWWGAMPVYWKLLERIQSSEILCHRVVWSALFTVILLAARGQIRRTLDFIKREPQKALTLCAGGFLVSFNWGIYIWGINHGHVLECSLGYYINPLVSMFLGLVFFREKMDKLQTAALLLAIAGVTVELIAVHSIPVLSLGLALTFGLYGALKKAIPIDSSASLCI
jgi:chloramphenicol-sensitive protein RarD